MEDWELKAREQIRDLVARYNAYGDTGRFDDLIALFADDAVAEIVGHQSYRGHDEIRALFSAAARPRSLENESASPVPTPIWHHTSTLVIDLESPQLARGRCYFAVLTPTGLDHWGRYRDQYRESNGRWLFAERRVRVDAMVDGGWAEQNLGSLPR